MYDDKFLSVFILMSNKKNNLTDISPECTAANKCNRSVLTYFNKIFL